MKIETPLITKSTQINSEIAELITQLTLENARLLLSSLRGEAMEPEQTEIIARLRMRMRKEQMDSPLFKHYDAKNEKFTEELEWWLSVQGEDDDDIEYMNIMENIKMT